MKQLSTPWHVEEKVQNAGTPKWLYLIGEQRYAGADGFMLDVCAEPWSAKCRYYFDEELDALSRPWALMSPVRTRDPNDVQPLGVRNDHAVFCNPQYDQIEAWLKKALFELDRGSFRLVTFLIPVRTDRTWWHEIVKPRAWLIEEIDGRVRFDPPPGKDFGSPFEASAFVTFQHRITTRR